MIEGVGLPNGVTDLGEKRERAKREILLALNARVHEAAKRFEGIEPGRDPWDFACECGASDCRLPVSLTLADYEALRAADRSVLAPGHENLAAGEAA